MMRLESQLFSLDDVGEPSLNVPEKSNARKKKANSYSGRNGKADKVKRRSQKHCTEALD